MASLWQFPRVGHRVLFRSERIVLLRPFKERNILLRSFSDFWRLMRPKRTMRSFAKNVKERKKRFVLLQRM